MIIRTCPICGKKFKVKSFRDKRSFIICCSKKCYNKKGSIKFKCEYCNKEVKQKLSNYQKTKHHFCSQKCHYNFRKTLPRKRKKSYVTKAGYKIIYSPNHPLRDNHGYVSEHRLVTEKYIGRYLKLTEIVHHIGIKYSISSAENRVDNRPKNLYYFSTNSKHMKYHWRVKKNIVEKLISNLV